MLDTAISNTTALECRYYYYYSDLKVEDIEVKLDKYLPKVTQLLGGGTCSLNCTFLTSNLVYFLIIIVFPFSPFPLEVMAGAVCW